MPHIEASPAIPKLLTLAEVREKSRLSRSTVDRKIANGWLPTVRIGRRVFVRESDLAAFIENASA